MTPLRILQAAAAIVSSTEDMSALLDAIGDEIVHVIPYHSLRIFLYDPVRDELAPIAVRSTLDDPATTNLTSGELRLRLGEGITGMIAKTRRARVVPDVTADPDAYYAPGAEPIPESFVGVPLVHRETLIGVLTLSRHGVGEFDDDQLAVLEILAACIAAALGQQRAVEAESRARSEEARLRELHTAFVANISHELRTPLTTALGFLELARGGAHTEAQLDDLIEGAYRGVRRLHELIDRLLEIVAVEAGRQRLKLAEHRVGDLVDEAIAESRASSSRVEAAGDLEAAVLVDRPRVVKILAELIDNAERYGPEAGHIHLDVVPGETQTEILVCDEGAGLSEELRERVFERFFQADADSTRRQGGAGIGLSLARAVARSHGGEIVVLPGEPTTFCLRLPAAPDHPRRSGLPWPAAGGR